jgi:hypothetical protein
MCRDTEGLVPKICCISYYKINNFLINAISNKTVKQGYFCRGYFIFSIISFLKGENVDFVENCVARLCASGAFMFFDSTTVIMTLIPLHITPAPYITVYYNN